MFRNEIKNYKDLLKNNTMGSDNMRFDLEKITHDFHDLSIKHERSKQA